MYETTNLSHADAMKIISAIQAQLDKEKKGAAIAVSDAHGELLAFLRTDGCPLPSIVIAMNKAYTASRERKPSKVVGQASKDEGFPMTNFGDLRYTAWGGGLPIIYKGQVIGAVGVSGLPEHEDIVLAQFGINAIAEMLQA
jgi:glc operon protein GlcG